MLIAHLPAGYIIGSLFRNKAPQARGAMLSALVGGLCRHTRHMSGHGRRRRHSAASPCECSQHAAKRSLQTPWKSLGSRCCAIDAWRNARA